MPRLRNSLVPLVTAMLCTAPIGLHAQSTDLPSAPAVPTPVFRVPPGSGVIVAAPKGDPPSPPPLETECYAAAVGIYAKHEPLTPALKETVARYNFEALHEIEVEWKRHMPFAAKDPWLKGREMAVRFAIMPDGSINTPLVTMHSGRESYDKHAVDAVIAAAPFAPLPEGLKRPLPICFHFIYGESGPKPPAPLDLWPPPAKTEPPK